MAEEKAMKTRYQNRKASILKKSKELSTLCDVKVCVIVVSPDGKLETWPDNLNDVKAVLSAVKESRKPIRSENHRGGGDRRLCSRIKIPEGKDPESCGGLGNNNNADEVCYDVCGTNFGLGIPDMTTYCPNHWNGSENFGKYLVTNEDPNLGYFGCGIHETDESGNNLSSSLAYHDQQYEIGIGSSSVCRTNFGMGIPDMTSRVNEAPRSYCPNHWNGNGNGKENEKSNSENFGKYMVTNEEPNLGYYVCGRHESGNNLDRGCGSGRYHHPYQYEIGSSSFNSGLNHFCNQQPSSSLVYHDQQYEIGIGSSSALNTTGVNNNLVHPNQQHTLDYQQYLMGNSAFNSAVGVDYPNQEPRVGVDYPDQEPSSSLAYHHYDIGIWE
nr:agamous-like MADS-box protein AGL81 [Ipomoea batatas]